MGQPQISQPFGIWKEGLRTCEPGAEARRARAVPQSVGEEANQRKGTVGKSCTVAVMRAQGAEGELGKGLHRGAKGAGRGGTGVEAELAATASAARTKGAGLCPGTKGAEPAPCGICGPACRASPTALSS